jgi:signal peptidase II
MIAAAKTAAVVFAVDQVTKLVVVRLLDLDRVGRIDVIPPFLSFRMAWNEGINFGLLASSHDLARWALILLALGISTWVWLWVRREPHSTRVQLSAGLLIGGALGNVVDRLIYGAVADFLNTSLPGWENPYSFNVADIAIFFGAVGLVLFTGKADGKAEAKPVPPMPARRRDKTP